MKHGCSSQISAKSQPHGNPGRATNAGRTLGAVSLLWLMLPSLLVARSLVYFPPSPFHPLPDDHLDDDKVLNRTRRLNFNCSTTLASQSTCSETSTNTESQNNRGSHWHVLLFTGQPHEQRASEPTHLEFCEAGKFFDCSAVILRFWRFRNSRKKSRSEKRFVRNADEPQSMSSYKPSPLGYGSGATRSSPFRRPQSPVSPSALRQTTPTASPTKQGPPGAGRFMSSPVTSPTQELRTPRGYVTVEDVPDAQLPQVRSIPRPPSSSSMGHGHGNSLSQLQPSQVRTMREAFQILDRDSDGVVNREDVVDMLNQLGETPRSLPFAVRLLTSSS